MNNSIFQIYEFHHRLKSRQGFAMFEGQRGEIIRQQIGINKSILDIGCRDGTLTKYYSKKNKVTGVDVDKRLLAKCKNDLKIKTVLFDVNSETWPFPKNHYDVVVTGEVLEHLYYPELVSIKIKKLLKPNGLFIGSVPHGFHLFDRLRFLRGIVPNSFHDPTHINIFSIDSLTNLLNRSFKTSKIIPLSGPRFSTLSRILPSLFSDDLIFIAHD